MIVGESAAIRKALALAQRFAKTRLPVLLGGERGTGKELLARFIHDQSGRQGEFVDVNCGAIPPSLAEGLLFGYRKGAFTGASDSHVGWVEESQGGTLFLDEFGDLPADCQIKVLRALETGQIRPLGLRGKRAVDLRVIAAVQADVGNRLANGALRADLVDRVAVGVIILPPLRERRDDIIRLATYFAQLDGRVFAPGVAAVLNTYDWPGNVRELRAVVARAGCLGENGTLSPAAIAEAIAMGAPLVLVDSRRIPATPAEWRLLGVRHGWHAGQMAAAVGLGRTTLFSRLKEQGLSLRSLQTPNRSSSLNARVQSELSTNAIPQVNSLSDRQLTASP